MKRSFEVSPAATRLALLILVPSAILMSPIAAAWAQAQLKTWADGDTLTAADLNANFAAVRAAIPTTPLPGYEIKLETFALPAVEAGSSFPGQSWYAYCTAGKKLLGGGCSTGNGEWHLFTSSPRADLTGWACYAENMGNTKPSGGGTTAATANAYAICASIP